jgi:hypothetical protein
LSFFFSAWKVTLTFCFGLKSHWPEKPLYTDFWKSTLNEITLCSVTLYYQKRPIIVSKETYWMKSHYVQSLYTAL